MISWWRESKLARHWISSSSFSFDATFHRHIWADRIMKGSERSIINNWSKPKGPRIDLPKKPAKKKQKNPKRSSSSRPSALYSSSSTTVNEKKRLNCYGEDSDEITNIHIYIYICARERIDISSDRMVKFLWRVNAIERRGRNRGRFHARMSVSRTPRQYNVGALRFICARLLRHVRSTPQGTAFV